MRLVGGRSGSVVLVDRDVEAALAEFFFNIDDTGGLIGEQMVPHPLHLAAREARLGDVDGGAGKVRADDVAFGIGGVVVDPHEVFLVLDGTHSGTDHQRLMELRFIGTGQVGEEVGCPGAAVAAIVRKIRIDHEAGELGYVDKLTTGDAILKVGVIFNALQGIFLSALILTDKRIVGSAKSIAPIYAWDIQFGNLSCRGGCL